MVALPVGSMEVQIVMTPAGSDKGGWLRFVRWSVYVNEESGGITDKGLLIEKVFEFVVSKETTTDWSR